MGGRSSSGLFHLSHGLLVGQQLSTRQTDPKSLIVLMQPDLGDIVWGKSMSTATTEWDHLFVKYGASGTCLIEESTDVVVSPTSFREVTPSSNCTHWPARLNSNPPCYFVGVEVRSTNCTAR